MSSNSKKSIIIVSVGIIIAIFIAIGVLRTKNSPAHQVIIEKERTIVSSSVPIIGGDFSLKDLNGRMWTQKDLLGKYSLIYFGYSYCPDICPTALYNVSNALKELSSKSILPIFITIDPQRDNVQQLRIYRQNFHSDFVFLTGTEDQVSKAIKVYRVHAAKAEEERGDDYLMDHSSIIYLMGPKGEFIKHFNHQTSAEDLIKGVQTAIEQNPI